MVFLKKLGAVLAATTALTGAVPTGNKDTPAYKDPHQPIKTRVDDLLSRMTVEDKMSQLIQGDLINWLNDTDYSFNYTGLEWNMKMRGGSVFTGRFVPWDVLSDMTKRGQDWLLQNTSLAIPAFMQSEGVHGFELINGTVFNSAIGYSSSWNRDLVEKMARVIGREARALLLENGNDMEMGGGHYSYETIPELIKSGELKEEYLDRAVRHVLHAKFAAGLFEEPFIGVPHDQFEQYIHTEEAVKISRQLDAESIVLLENHNQTLPLKKEGNIAVIGHFGDIMNYGDYVIPKTAKRGVTPLAGIKAAVGDKANVHFAKGCAPWSPDRSGFQEAVELANKSDVAIVMVGTWSADQGDLWSGANVTTGEGADMDDLHLVGPQADLIREVKKTGVPTIVVFTSGKPITEPWLSEHVDALLQHYYPGEQGGNALADVLFGAHNPSGRLTISFPRSVGDLPVYYDHLNSARQAFGHGQVYENGTMEFGRNYVLGDPNPWYDFGYGLSYSEFEYSNVTLSTKNVTDCNAEYVNATVTVTNKGPYAGQEVVQVYVRDVLASVDIPNKSLRGFEKVHLDCKESKKVTIPIKLNDLALWSMKNEYVIEAGDFEVQVGRSSQDIKTTAIFNVAKSKVVKM
ncbi:Glycoside hydrolase, family 3 [Ascosphaera apis ARSEF 7405]|uniref:beta-glucosidase n=1 Tax=Ascosphaera apis ARSEF 7405 TaxID=392613 RepID=A0A167YPT3_9EURO|nr:Glycoside hydrolase, family 3 [Ascosphaera apis ARSEF 7405]